MPFGRVQRTCDECKQVFERVDRGQHPDPPMCGMRCRNRRYYRENREQLLASQKVYDKNNRKDVLEMKRVQWARRRSDLVYYAEYLEKRKHNGKWKRLKKLLGMTREEHETMYKNQAGLCAICHKPPSIPDNPNATVKDLVVDHDHTTGRVRALLCAACNTAIGLFGEDPEVMRSAALYVRRHQVGDVTFDDHFEQPGARN